MLQDGTTPLSMASGTNDVEAMQVLLAAKASVDQPDKVCSLCVPRLH